LISIEKPTISNVEQIKKIVDYFAKKQDILPRPIEDITERIREFVVAKDNDIVIGTSSLRLYYPDLGEIRTITVCDKYQHKHIGKMLVDFEISEAKKLNVKYLFALTFRKRFFERMDFKLIDKKELPLKKIWEDCIKCPFFPDCKEEAMIMNL